MSRRIYRPASVEIIDDDEAAEIQNATNDVVELLEGLARHRRIDTDGKLLILSEAMGIIRGGNRQGRFNSSLFYGLELQ